MNLTLPCNMQAALQDAGIEPSDSREYARTEIEAAIHKAYGVNALVHCDAQHHLSEVGPCTHA